MKFSWIRTYRGAAVALMAGTVALLAVALLAVPALTSSSTVPRPRAEPTPEPTTETTQTPKAAATYGIVPRCDDELATLRPSFPGVSLDDPTGEKPIIQLVGNSLVVGITPCFEKLVQDSGFALETVSGSGMASCNFISRLREQVANPATRPDIAVWFSFDWFVGRPGSMLHACNTDWRQAPEEALRIWVEAGVHVYLVPMTPRVTPSSDPNLIQFPTGSGTMDAPAQLAEFRSWAAQYPGQVTIVDAGLFIRDANGLYQWRMPCIAPDEPGCAPDGTVGVRWTDEFHYCADPAYNGGACAPQFSGGDRRVAAAIALQINELQGQSAGALELPTPNILDTPG